jgi:hypothetical protein
MHGGSAPQTIRAARLRLLAAADAAAAALVEVAMGRTQPGKPKPTASDRVRAAQAILDRAGLGPAVSVDMHDADRPSVDTLLRLLEGGDQGPNTTDSGGAEPA